MLEILTDHNKEQLRQQLVAALPGLSLLRAADRHTVRKTIAKRTVDAARRALAPTNIQPPTLMPWKCNRCNKEYQNKSWANRHAEANECKPRRKKRAAPRAKKTKRQEPGRPRRLTWLTNIHKVLRRTAPEILQRKYPGCRPCQQRHRQCERCYFLEWMKAAQERGIWGKIVYEYEDHNDGTDGKKKKKLTWPRSWDPPVEKWKDPRDTEVAHGGLLWGTRVRP